MINISTHINPTDKVATRARKYKDDDFYTVTITVSNVGLTVSEVTFFVHDIGQVKQLTSQIEIEEIE